MRRASYRRETEETKISVEIDLDGSGRSELRVEIPFIAHLLKTLAVHSWMDLRIEATGDLQHHLIEDIAITLGRALDEALGDRMRLRRFGYALIPMDDVLALASVDLIRRPYSAVDLKLSDGRVEGVESTLLEHFFRSLASTGQFTMHLAVLYGVDDHHKVEAAVKALAISLRDAWAIGGRISTAKGACD